MRLAFNLVILAGAIFYTWIAFTDLALLTPNDRLGPGFFPRVIGVLIIVTIVYSFWADRRHQLPSDEPSDHLSDVTVFAIFGVGFVAAMHFLGGPVGMVVYMLVALSYFNRGKHVQNVILSLVLPAAVFLMFDTWLNASLPEARLFW